MVSGCQFARPGTYYPPALWLVGVSLILAGITDTRTRRRHKTDAKVDANRIYTNSNISLSGGGHKKLKNSNLDYVRITGQI